MSDSTEIVKEIHINDYTYELPVDKIAKYPVNERDLSKLLIFRKGQIEEDIFQNLSGYLKADSLLVFNNTKVIRARLVFKKESGAQIEIFLLEPYNPADYNESFNRNDNTIWKCLTGNLKRWKKGFLEKEIKIRENKFSFRAELIQNTKEFQIIQFSWNNCSCSFSEIIELTGKTPIPPYLKRDSEEVDINRYQTIYSKYEGSVASPTAGLHFTDDVIKKILKKGIKKTELTLHVGAGTFRPVKSTRLIDHSMHNEFFSVTLDSLEMIYNHLDRIIAVGTTSLRSLESIYWLGVKLIISDSNNFESFHIDQWFPYNITCGIEPSRAINAIIEYLKRNHLSNLEASTKLLILPGYQFNMIKGLITNYHQPKSTLLLLIAAFVGEDWKKIYQYALNNNFRFLSYGDCSLLIP